MYTHVITPMGSKGCLIYCFKSYVYSEATYTIYEYYYCSYYYYYYVENYTWGYGGLYILLSEIDLNSDVGRHIQCYTILYSYLKDMHTDNIL